MKKLLIFTVFLSLLTSCTSISPQKEDGRNSVLPGKNIETSTGIVTQQAQTGLTLDTWNKIEQRCLLYSGWIIQLDTSGNPNGLSLNLPEFSGEDSRIEFCSIDAGSITILPHNTCTPEANSDCSPTPKIKYIQCEENEINDGFGKCIKEIRN